MTQGVTSAAREQEVSTGQIDQAIVHINDMTLQVQQATLRQLVGVQQVLDVAKKVTSLIDRNLENSQQVTHAADGLLSHADILSHPTA
ncbi:MAG: hypothetical protein GY801_33390 [bacterium]|nr:hypothetical protein [bacterium]